MTNTRSANKTCRKESYNGSFSIITNYDVIGVKRGHLLEYYALCTMQVCSLIYLGLQTKAIVFHLVPIITPNYNFFKLGTFPLYHTRKEEW